MQTRVRRVLKDSLIALAATAFFTLIRLVLDPLLGERTPLFLQILPVAFAAWRSGWTGGVAATILNAFVGAWLFIPPRFQLIPMDLVEQVRVAVFIGTGVLISQLYESLHQARRAVVDQADVQKQLNLDTQLWRARYEAAVNSSGCILYDSNRKTGEVVYGGGCEQILGYTAEQLNGPVAKWIELIHPDDRDTFQQELTRTNRSRSPYSADYRMISADGRTVWMRDDGHFAWAVDGQPPDNMIGFVKDVTAHRTADLERMRMAERLMLLTDHTPLAVIEWNADFVITRWSGQAEKIFGWSAEEVLGLHFYDFPIVHPEDAHLVHETVNELRKPSKLHYVNQNRNLTKSGQVVSSVWYNSVVYDQTGEVDSVLSLVLDVTERQNSEAELRRSEERFRQLADAMPQVVWMADKEGKVNYYNSRVANLSGVTTTTEGMWEWLPVLHPDDMPATMHDWQDAIQNGTPYEREHRIHMADGSYRWHLSRGLPTLSRTIGEIVWFGTATDVHELKMSQNALRESEATLRGVYETSPLLMGVIELGPTDILHIYDNPATCRFLQLPFGATTGRWARELGTPEVIIELWMSHFRQSELTQSPVAFRSGHWTADGERQLSVTVSRLDCSSGGQTRFCYVAEDVTERLRDEQELRDAHRRKDEFLATLAHELRNPLAPIRTGLEVLRMANGDTELIDQIRRTMERQTQQLITLVDDLLDVSRITQGRLELRRCRVGLREIMQSAVEASQPFIDESRHTLSISFPKTPVSLDADPNRLAQVISNLLNNAAKYTPEGGRIDLKVEGQPDSVLISVKDNGIGVAPEMQRQIFEMFAQISDRPLERGFRGLGIGLTLVRSLVEMHGGRIEVRSPGVNQGSEFVVSLPAIPETLPEPLVVPQGNTETLSGGGRVLVVDDNKEAATMLSMLVKMLGSEVRTVHDGEDAFRVAGEFLPDLILMDIGMPKMNGYDAAALIRQQEWGRRIVLVALTGWGQTEDKQRSREAGFDDHLVKPAEPAQLQQLLVTARERSAKG